MSQCFCVGSSYIGPANTRTIKTKNLYNSDIYCLYDILVMFAYLVLSIVATLIQSNTLSAIFLYVHICLNFGIAVFAGKYRWHTSILLVL